MKSRIAGRVFEVLELRTPTDRVSRVFNISMMTLISLNVAVVILETVGGLSLRYATLFRRFEVFSVTVFTIEYIVRLWACTSDARLSRPIVGRVKYAFTLLAFVDLLAVLPFYLPLIIPFDLRFVRALRLLRIFRMFKLGRYSDSLKTLGAVLKQKREELFISVFVVFILLILSSSLMYYVEHEVQPEAFSSIPATMWWGVTTLTTVGYGDICPVTSLGKLLGAIIAFLGIGMFALPAGIFASGFAEEIRSTRKVICPHCGKAIE